MSNTIISISDWRDRSRFESLVGLDQAELDWAFATRHPAVQELRRQPELQVRLLRRDPLLRFLTFARPECLRAMRGLRFCRR
jgi:hypothetical protein